MRPLLVICQALFEGFSGLFHFLFFAQMTAKIPPAMQDTDNMNRGFIDPVENNMAARLEAPEMGSNLFSLDWDSARAF